MIANDIDKHRCGILIHQIKRFNLANVLVTNHSAESFPFLSIDETSQLYEKGTCEIGKNNKPFLQFDRILCDVPCSGDGTLRKSPDIWAKWNEQLNYKYHK